MLIRSGFVDITPIATPVQVAGDGKGVVATHVRDTLECSVMLVWPEGADDDPIAIVTMDVLYVGAKFRSRLSELLGHGWQAERLFLAASHTHYAPALDWSKPQLGRVDGEYFRSTAAAVASLIRSLRSQGPLEADLSAATTDAATGVNRRRRRPLRLLRTGIEVDRVGIGPNPTAEVDDRILTAVLSCAGRPIAVLWEAACHPTSLPQPIGVSAHFPGVVRERIRALYGDPTLPVLFFQGFSGDIRPLSPPPTLRSPKALVDRVRLGRGFGPFSESQYRNWTAGVANNVIAALAQVSVLSSAPVRATRWSFPRDDMVTGSRTSTPGSIHILKLGELLIFGVSAEPVHEYAKTVRSDWTSPFVITAGCIDTVWGYLPSSCMIGAGGYEVEGFCEYFDVSGVHPQCEDAFRLHASRAIAQLAPGGDHDCTAVNP